MSVTDVLHMLASEIEKLTGHDRPDLHEAVDATVPPPPAPPAAPSEADTPVVAFGTESQPEAGTADDG